jgi:hypothetical protein
MNSPDETRTFDKGKVDLTKIGDTSIGKCILNLDGAGKNV